MENSPFDNGMSEEQILNSLGFRTKPTQFDVKFADSNEGIGDEEFVGHVEGLACAMEEFVDEKDLVSKLGAIAVGFTSQGRSFAAFRESYPLPLILRVLNGAGEKLVKAVLEKAETSSDLLWMVLESGKTISAQLEELGTNDLANLDKEKAEEFFRRSAPHVLALMAVCLSVWKHDRRLDAGLAQWRSEGAAKTFQNISGEIKGEMARLRAGAIPNFGTAIGLIATIYARAELEIGPLRGQEPKQEQPAGQPGAPGVPLGEAEGKPATEPVQPAAGPSPDDTIQEQAPKIVIVDSPRPE
ncbi:MAG: hypothetical protein IT443_12035 [Phycisphaeraceae bacterium]|nr:hypothetical protein [Phycisphaeraceae bacterium]